MNSYCYNQKHTDIYKMTTEMEKHFLKLQSGEEVSEKPKKVKLAPPKPAKQSLFDTPMTVAEKRHLGQNIRKLPTSYLMGIWHIVSECGGGTNDLIEFDIDTLPVRKTRELDEYVRSVLNNEGMGSGDGHKEVKRAPAEEAEESSFSISES
jgi:hypothetical protein